MRLFYLFGFVFSMPLWLLAHDRLDSISIFQNSPEFNSVGYGEPDGNFNGEKKIIQNILKENDVIFDIGADIGGWSTHVLEANKNVFLHVFEPVPTSFDFLKETLNFPNVCLYNLALGQENRTADFFVYAGSKGSTNCSSLYYRPVIEHALSEKIAVEMQTLDHFCKIHNFDHVDFLKIDAEGAEWFIFLGAQELLNRKAITLIQFEYGGCNIDSKTTLQQIYELLTSKGYTIYRIVPDGLIEIHTWDSELENFQYSNYLASLNES